MLMLSKRVILILSTIAVTINADEIRSSIGYIDFDNSKKKSTGIQYSGGFTFKYRDSTFYGDFSKRNIDTKKPPLTQNLKVKKSNFKYREDFQKIGSFEVSFIGIDDNIAPTDNGKIYGVGYLNSFESIGLKTNLFYSDYRDFDVYQSDLTLSKVFKFSKFKSTIALKGSYIDLSDYEINPYTKNSDGEYLNSEIRVGFGYRGFKFAIFNMFGERLFSVLGNGSKVQHHSMEIKKAYGVMLAKSFKSFRAALSHSHQVAKELPINNSNVKVDGTFLTLTYLF